MGQWKETDEDPFKTLKQTFTEMVQAKQSLVPPKPKMIDEREMKADVREKNIIPVVPTTNRGSPQAHEVDGNQSPVSLVLKVSKRKDSVEHAHDHNKLSAGEMTLAKNQSGQQLPSPMHFPRGLEEHSDSMLSHLQS